MAYLMGAGSITQNVSGWTAGTYTLSFLAAQRGNYAGNAQVLQVKIDGAVVATITPSGTGYRTYTAVFAVSAGAHSVAIVGTVADHTAFLDNVALVPTSRASQRWTVYDGDRPILDFNGAGTQTARYLQSGPDLVDEVLARETASGVAWYLPDRLGTIRDLADNSGAVINHVDYNAFGGVEHETAPAVGDRMMGFAGMERSRATGLNLAVHRVQDPDTGAWLSEDPIGFAARDPNLRRYVGNDPVDAADPSGLEVPGDNHCYPLHLGGYPKGQPLYPMNGADHTRFHDYFRDRGVGSKSGDIGRTVWKGMEPGKQKQFLCEAMKHANVPESWIQANIDSVMKGARPGFNFSPYRKASRATLAKIPAKALIAGVAFDILANPSTAYAAEVRMDWRDSVASRRYGDCQRRTEVAMFQRIVMVPGTLNLFGEVTCYEPTRVSSWEDQGLMTAGDARLMEGVVSSNCTYWNPMYTVYKETYYQARWGGVEYGLPSACGCNQCGR